MNRSGTPADHDPPLSTTAVLLTLLTVILWGGLPTAVRFSTEVIPPVAVAGLRFAMAAAFTAMWAIVQGTPLLLPPRQLVRPLIGGILLFAQIALFTVGIHLSNASHGSVVVNTFVFWVVAIEHFLPGTARLHRRQIAGLLLAAISVGMILLTIPEAAQPATEAPSFEGDLMLVISALILAVKTLYTRASVHQLHPDQFVTWHAVFGTVFFAVWSLLTEDFPATQLTLLHDAQVRNAVLAVAYQGVIVAGFCFALQARLLQLYSASRVSVFSFATPLFGILFAVILRGDDLSPWLFVSGAGVAAGIALVNQGSSGPAGRKEQ